MSIAHSVNTQVLSVSSAQREVLQELNSLYKDRASSKGQVICSNELIDKKVKITDNPSVG